MFLLPILKHPLKRESENPMLYTFGFNSYYVGIKT